MRAPSRRDEWADYVDSLAAPVKPAAPFDGPLAQARRLLAFAHGFSRTGNAAGNDCWLPPTLERRFTRRSCERYLAVLVDHGLVTRTAAPARGTLGKPGRRARYALVIPENVRHESDGSWRTFAVARLADVVRGPWSAETGCDGGPLSTTSANLQHESVRGTYSLPTNRAAA